MATLQQGLPVIKTAELEQEELYGKNKNKKQFPYWLIVPNASKMIGSIYEDTILLSGPYSLQNLIELKFNFSVQRATSNYKFGLACYLTILKVNFLDNGLNFHV